MGILQKKIAATASSFARVDGENSEQTITSAESILHSITVSGDGALGTLIISNGAAATAANILTQLEIVSGESRTYTFNVRMTNGIRVTPSVTTVDSVIIYDGP